MKPNLTLTKAQIHKLIANDPLETLHFYRQIKPILHKYFLHKISDSHDRQEIIQDTILSILDSLPAFEGDCQITTYIYTIAHHELVDYYRKKKIKHILFSHFPLLEKIADKALGPQLALEEKEKKQQIYNCLKNLSEGYSEILRLRYIEGLSVKKIANQLDISYKAAESKLSRARLAFQKEFV